MGFWAKPNEITDKKAAEIFLCLGEKGDITVPDPKIYEFYVGLTKDFSDSEMTEENEENNPWANQIEWSENYVVLNISFSFVEKMYPIIKELSHRYGLVCYDPQIGKVVVSPRTKIKTHSKHCWEFWK